MATSKTSARKPPGSTNAAARPVTSAAKSPRSAPKGSAAGPGPTVSDVSAFIASLEARWRGPIEALRAGLLATPSVTEHIKWKAPSFCHEGDDRVTLRVPPKGGLQLVFHRGVAVKDTRGFVFEDRSGLVVWAAPDRGIVTLETPEALAKHTSAVLALARAWMAATRDE